MQSLIAVAVGVFAHGSGLLIWPSCALVWRRKRRTPALGWVFIVELGCQLVLGGFAAFFPGLLEHEYYWLALMIVANLVFTLLAIGAACRDYFSGSSLDA